MTPVRVFFIILAMFVSTVANAEAWVVKKSFAFPTTEAGAITSKTLSTDVTDPEKREGHLLITAMILINSGEINLVGVDMTLVDGYIASLVLHSIAKRGEGNRIRILGQTKRYPVGLMDAPERLARWITLSRQHKLVTDVIPDPDEPDARLVAVVFYQEASAERGRIPPHLIAVAKEAIAGK